VIECAPTLRSVVLKVATPVALIVPVPSVVVPSRNVTVPVGVPEPGASAATVAVKVSDWPKEPGLALEVSEVVVADWLTTTSPVPVLVRNWLLPAKATWIARTACPEARKLGASSRIARPVLSVTAVPA